MIIKTPSGIEVHHPATTEAIFAREKFRKRYLNIINSGRSIEESDESGATWNTLEFIGVCIDYANDLSLSKITKPEDADEVIDTVEMAITDLESKKKDSKNGA